MYRISPAQFHRLSPRERMVASLNGLGNSNSGTEVRGTNGALLSVVPSSAPAKEMMRSILSAPDITPPWANGRFQIESKPADFNWRDRNISNPPPYVRAPGRTEASMVRRLAGFGTVNPAMLTQTLAPSPVDAGLVQRSLTSRSLPPPGPAPVYQGGGVAPAGGGGVAPAGGGTSPPSMDDEYGPPGFNPPGSQPPPTGNQTPPASAYTEVSPITAAPAGLPMWKVGLGAVAVFGTIWYLTRK